MLRRTLTLTAVCAVALTTSIAGAHASSRAGLTSPPITQEVSVALTGGSANGYGDRPEISGDGLNVTFDSDSNNMTAPPLSRQREIYERDLTTQTTQLVSIGIDGKAANDWSSFSWPDEDGSLVTFTSDATNLVSTTIHNRNVYVRNTSSQPVLGIPADTTELVSNPIGTAYGASSRSMISPSGQYIAFDSAATLIPGLATDGQSEEYLYNVQTKEVTLVSADAAGDPANGLSYRGMVSDDGSIVTFNSKATNLLSPATDTNGQEDIFVKDMTTGAIKRISVRYPGGAQSGGGSRPYMSPDGQWVTFSTPAVLLASVQPPAGATAHANVYVYNTETGVLTLGSPGLNGALGNGDSLRGFITDDGRYVVFNSFASNLTTDKVGSHGNCFIYDTQTGLTRVISQGVNGTGSNGNSFRPVPSSDGSEITYLSQATNLISGGSNPAPPTTAQVSATIKPADDEETSYEVFATSLDGTSPGGDTTAPAATITSPVAGSTVTSPLTLAGAATDNVAVASVGVAVQDTTTGGTNSGEWLQADGTFSATETYLPATLAAPNTTSTTWSLPVPAIPSSDYQAVLQVTDKAGNTPTDQTTESFTVYNPPPDTKVVAKLVKATSYRLNEATRHVRATIDTGEPVTARISFFHGRTLIKKGALVSYPRSGDHRMTLSIKNSYRKKVGKIEVALTDRAGNTKTLTKKIKVHS